MSEPTERGGGWLRRSLLLVGAVVAVLALAELALAWIRPQPTFDRVLRSNLAIFEPSDFLPYRLRPASSGALVQEEFETTVHINSHGYRGPEFQTPKPAGTRRVLAIGDSFTFGWGVEDDETYPARLDEALGEDVEVINAGFAAGYYPDTYYVYLREYGLALEPDLIVIGFYVGNDIDHDRVHENEWTESTEDGLPVRVRSTTTQFVDGFRFPIRMPWPYRYPVLRNSHLVHALVRLGKQRPETEPVEYFNHFIYRADYLPRTREAVGKVQRLLGETHELASAAGVPLVVVLIPAREQILPEAHPFERFEYMQGHELDKPQRLFVKSFEKRGIHAIDLLPAMRAKAREEELYFPKDRHWNRAGCDFAAQRIAEGLAAIGQSGG